MANDGTVKIGVDFSADDIKRGYKTIQDEGKKTATLADFIPDPAAAAEMDGMEVRIGVAAILAELPEDQQRAVRGKYWHDFTVDKKILNAAMKRLRHPDCSKRLRAYL